jgi:hypothetical protein
LQPSRQLLSNLQPSG